MTVTILLLMILLAAAVEVWLTIEFTNGIRRMRRLQRKKRVLERRLKTEIQRLTKHD